MLDARTLGADPSDEALLELAAATERVLVTIDTDFGELIYLRGASHAGLIRLPDTPAQERIALLAQVMERHSQDIEARAVVTIRGGRVRISHPPAP